MTLLENWKESLQSYMFIWLMEEEQNSQMEVHICEPWHEVEAYSLLWFTTSGFPAQPLRGSPIHSQRQIRTAGLTPGFWDVWHILQPSASTYCTKGGLATVTATLQKESQVTELVQLLWLFKQFLTSHSKFIKDWVAYLCKADAKWQLL